MGVLSIRKDIMSKLLFPLFIGIAIFGSITAAYLSWKKKVVDNAIQERHIEATKQVEEKQEKKIKKAEKLRKKDLERNAKLPIIGDDIPPKKKIENLFKSLSN